MIETTKVIIKQMERVNQQGRDLYILLGHNYDTLDVSRSDDGMTGFRDFINSQTDIAAWSPLIPDH